MNVHPPSAESGWIYTNGEPPPLCADDLIFVIGRMGDVFGPIPFELVTEEAWRGNAFHYRHDLAGYLPVDPAPAGTRPQGGDAKQGSMRSTSDAVPKAGAQTPSGDPS